MNAVCNAPESCSHVLFDGSTCNQLNLQCGNDHSCEWTDVYCPYSTIASCNIDCAPYSYSCYEVDIIVKSAYFYGYLNITCPLDTIYGDLQWCDTIDIQEYDADDETDLEWNADENEWRAGNHNKARNTIISCNENCTIDCDPNYNYCAGNLIDARFATYLNVECGSSYSCNNSVIYCPEDGCSITCSTFGCSHVAIIYDGTNDTNGKISIECSDGSACEYAIINVRYAKEVYINCTGNYSCRYMKVYGDYASSVALIARGTEAFYQSRIYVQNANSANIKCIQYGCRDSRWYLPTDTTLQCYGTGCDADMGTFYFVGSTDAGKIQIDVNQCGEDECEESFYYGACFGHFDVYCVKQTDGYKYNIDSEWSNCGTQHDIYSGNRVTSYRCYCVNMMQNIKYTNNYTDEYCFYQISVDSNSKSRNNDDATTILIISVVSVIILLIIFFLIMVKYGYCKQCEPKTPPSHIIAEATVNVNPDTTAANDKNISDVALGTLVVYKASESPKGLSEEEEEPSLCNSEGNIVTTTEAKVDENQETSRGQNEKMKAFMGELEELIGIIQKHLDFMEKQDSVVDVVINKSAEKNRLEAAKKVALKNEKELLEEIMNYHNMNAFLDDIILIENLFNNLYASKKDEQENARNLYAQNIEIYENKKKPICEVASFVDLLFEGTMLGIGEFKKWLKNVEYECKKQGIEIIDSSGVKAKNIERAFYKAFYVYGINDIDGGFKQMTDVLRCSLVFDHFDHLYRCFTVIEMLSKENNGGILRCKDRFNPQNVEFGYRDLLINIYCPQSKIVCEIQLHYVMFYKHKKVSHGMYKKARLFEDSESGQNLAYRYADKNNRKHVGDKIYQLQNDKKNDEAYKLLNVWNLDTYAQVLIDEEGYDDTEQWEELTVDRLQEMGFKEGHAKKFVKKVSGMQ